MTIYCKKDETELLKEALMTSSLVDWNTPQTFYMPVCISEAVECVVASKGVDGWKKRCCETFIYQQTEPVELRYVSLTYFKDSVSRNLISSFIFPASVIFIINFFFFKKYYIQD